jgi:hypothetical protein
VSESLSGLSGRRNQTPPVVEKSGLMLRVDLILFFQPLYLSASEGNLLGSSLDILSLREERVSPLGFSLRISSIVPTKVEAIFGINVYESDIFLNIQFCKN